MKLYIKKNLPGLYKSRSNSPSLAPQFKWPDNTLYFCKDKLYIISISFVFFDIDDITKVLPDEPVLLLDLPTLQRPVLLLEVSILLMGLNCI
jgi:hypothetical protein